MSMNFGVTHWNIRAVKPYLCRKSKLPPGNVTISVTNNFRGKSPPAKFCNVN